MRKGDAGLVYPGPRLPSGMPNVKNSDPVRQHFIENLERITTEQHNPHFPATFQPRSTLRPPADIIDDISDSGFERGCDAITELAATMS
jgi:hypothetical protein